MKLAISTIIAIVIAALIASNYKFLKRYYYVYFGVDQMFIASDSDNFDRGPAVGAGMPDLNALYQGDNVSSLTELQGARGTVFVINRSLEWCPYCMRQTIELQKQKQAFDDAGIAIVMMTYDEPELLQAFIERHDIGFPVLSDINAISFNNLGVLREEYGPEHEQYGLPYPGMIVVDIDGVIQGKLFIEAYSTRVDTSQVLKFAKDKLTAN